LQGLVEKILEPYILKQIEDLGIHNETPTTWLTNHWSLHKSIDFPYMVEEKTSSGQVPFGANKLHFDLHPTNFMPQHSIDHILTTI
jgi:hypothetical protein